MFNMFPKTYSNEKGKVLFECGLELEQGHIEMPPHGTDTCRTTQSNRHMDCTYTKTIYIVRRRHMARNRASQHRR